MTLLLTALTQSLLYFITCVWLDRSTKHSGLEADIFFLQLIGCTLIVIIIDFIVDSLIGDPKLLIEKTEQFVDCYGWISRLISSQRVIPSL